VIVGVAWRGPLDGEVVLTLDEEDAEGRTTEVVVDRPGDLVARMMAEEFAEESLLERAAMYGYCLASRGIAEPIFVDQIIRKVGPFLRSARIDSMALYRLTERVPEIARRSGREGRELREFLLEEAHRTGSGDGSAEEGPRGERRD